MNTLMKNAVLAPFNLLYRVSPELCLRALFRLKQGRRLNLDDPKTFNEKLQWLKLHYRDPLMPVCSDKYEVRRFVEERGCGDMLNELYWQGFDPKEIPYDDLPDSFVVKVTHGSTFNIIVRDKSSLNRRIAAERLARWLRARFIPCYGEWFYGKVRPRIVVERFLDDGSGSSLRDYKVFCFGGTPCLVSVYSDRGTVCHQDIYDTEWNYLSELEGSYPRSGKPIERPSCLDQLLSAARKLSAGFPHARVDFFVVNGKPVFGEITFTSAAGFSRFGTPELDELMGSWLELPEGGWL